MIDNKQEKTQKIAQEILQFSRNTVLVKMRFLSVAMNQLEPTPCEEITFGTDGKKLYYTPNYLITRYVGSKDQCAHDYLHVLLHGIFCHMFVTPAINQLAWDLACDIAVENAILELNISSVTSPNETKQRSIINKLKQEVKYITAEKLYHYFLEENPTDEQLIQLREAFMMDDHSLWYLIKITITLSAEGDSSENQDSPNGQAVSPDGQKENGLSMLAKQLLKDEWDKISRQIQEDLSTFSKRQGEMAGSMMQNLKELHREKYDYSEFLRKFAVLGEALKINDEEFDNTFYTYGLQLYDNMPLIEPLEYKDIKKIKEFVIAIDTSGSTSGETVQKFLQKTYNILKQSESFFSRINLHIIQCDAVIQEDVKITNQEEFDQYIKKLTIKGLGGTDFRPVFDYVNKLQAEKEFINLKGLIYFTDGYGTFPQKQPSYQTAFVFLDDGMNNLNVPIWAMKLILQKEEI